MSIPESVPLAQRRDPALAARDISVAHAKVYEVRREFSAGGVLVCRADGRWLFAAIRPAGKPEGLWVLPKGQLDEGESSEAAAIREVAEETGVRGRSVAKLGDTRYWFSWDGERVFKVVSFFLVEYESRHDRRRPGRVPARGRRGPLAPARRGPGPAGLPRRARDDRAGNRAAGRRSRTYDREPLPAFALNFYSPVVEAQLRSHRKTATIRLGDKSRKYQKGMIVSVLVGARYGPRQHVFDAVVDKVEVKRLAELSPREIEHDNPEVRRPEEMARFLSQLYNRDVSEDDTVTVIRFSAIKPN